MSIYFRSEYDPTTRVFRIKALDGNIEVGEFCYNLRTKELVRQQYPSLAIFEDKLYPLGVDVNVNYRRRKLATRFYEIAEEISGLRIMPGDPGSVEPDGAKFRERYERTHGTWLEPFRKS